MMNLYQLITGGLNDLKQKLDSEQQRRAQIERRLSVVENRITLWSLALFLLSLLFSAAVVIQRLTQFSQISHDYDTNVVVNYTFNLDNSWINYFLRKVKLIHLKQKEQITIWDITWNIDGTLEETSTGEIFTVSVTPTFRRLPAKTTYEIKVLIFDKNDLPLPTETEFVPILTTDSCNKYKNVAYNMQKKDTTSGSISSVPFNKIIDVHALRKINSVDDSIGVTLYIRKSKWSKDKIKQFCEDLWKHSE